jgi:ABC-type glycerol-3-phosphate transport system substrate-binding protein
MAIAFMANVQHLALRQDVLEGAGITEAPGSYEEVLAAAEAIRAAGLMEHPLGANMKSGWDLAAEFVNMYLGLGGELFAPGSAELALDDAKAAQALEMMKALAAYMAPDFATYDSSTLAPLFAQGQVAMVNMWGSRTGAFLDPAQATPEVVETTVLTRAPTVGGGAAPATTIWWDGFTIAANASDEDAEASFRAMLHGIETETATANPDLAAWLIPGHEPTPAVVGVIETAMAGARPYPIDPWMGTLHEALGTELAGFMNGTEEAGAAIEGVRAAYEAAARGQGFLD